MVSVVCRRTLGRLQTDESRLVKLRPVCTQNALRGSIDVINLVLFLLGAARPNPVHFMSKRDAVRVREMRTEDKTCYRCFSYVLCVAHIGNHSSGPTEPITAAVSIY